MSHANLQLKKVPKAKEVTSAELYEMMMQTWHRGLFAPPRERVVFPQDVRPVNDVELVRAIEVQRMQLEQRERIRIAEQEAVQQFMRAAERPQQIEPIPQEPAQTFIQRFRERFGSRD